MADGVEHVGQQVTVPVVHGDAALAGQVQPVVAEQVDLGLAVAGHECLADHLFQVRVKAGGGLAVGQGHPCPDGAQVEQVARLRRRGWRVPGRVLNGRFDLGDVVQVPGQSLRVLPGDLGDHLARPLREGAGIIGLVRHGYLRLTRFAVGTDERTRTAYS
jgi:hypothetical protein